MIRVPNYELHPDWSQNTENEAFIRQVLQDLWICVVSREASLMGRREVLTGKAKFGIFGGGKELPQVAMARFFQKGDHRAGYYRDQTFAFALGLSSLENFFAQLYADTQNDPFSGGRQMNSHFATPYIDSNDDWLDLSQRYNISSDISPTAGQMARGLGLAHASQIYKNLDLPEKFKKLSEDGKEVCFVTIGDASTSEGIFWETINAAAVSNAPLAVSVWDDGYGISVPSKYQTVKQSISKALKGFAKKKVKNQGIHIFNVKGWDYPSLINVYDRAIQRSRDTHTPVLIHIEQLTQPQGHSTSGSHERYKNAERLQWEKDLDCNEQFVKWILDKKMVTEDTIEQLRQDAKLLVKEAKQRAWENFTFELPKIKIELLAAVQNIPMNDAGTKIVNELSSVKLPSYGEIIEAAELLKVHISMMGIEVPADLQNMITTAKERTKIDYHSSLYSPNDEAIKSEVAPIYSKGSSMNGFEVLNHFFDKLFETRPEVIAFGEDVGKIGDVNQGFAGIQEKYGENRIFDTGIREWSIVGQAIGMAMRGLRPIAEIQYLDYIMYAISPLTDDLATLRYRSDGIQKAPAIIRTRGHRLEGIWHSGSHLGMLINSLRGMHICVPRNMTQAIGFYNTLLAGNDPGLVIEVLNGYRLKERLPDNILEFKIPLGIPEVILEGEDVTLVTYGACVRIAEKACKILEDYDMSVELIDVRTLLPFDTNHIIGRSIAKTGRVIFMDEDLPGAATAYMLQEVLENQSAFFKLDASPTTITASEHRPPFGSDGDYFSKPTEADVIHAVLRSIEE